MLLNDHDDNGHGGVAAPSSSSSAIVNPGRNDANNNTKVQNGGSSTLDVALVLDGPADSTPRPSVGDLESMASTGSSSKSLVTRELEPVIPFEVEMLGPPKTATWQTAGWLMVADVVGAGVMALATAFAEVGWFWGFVSSTGWFIANMYIGIIILECRMQWPHAHSFMDLSYFAFGHRAKQFTGFAVYTMLTFVLGDYIVILGECLQHTFYDAPVCPVVWTFLSMLCLLPLMQYRLLANVRILLYVNVFTILLAVLLALAELTAMGQTAALAMSKGQTEIVSSSMTFNSFAHAQALNSFAYSGVFVYLEIMSEMREPQEFKKSLLFLSGPFQYILYICVGAWGYAYIGSTANGLLIGNIPKGPAYRIASIALFLHILFTYLVKGIVLARAIHRFVAPSTLNDFTLVGRVTYFGVTCSILTFTFIIANLVPFFDDLTSLIGALQMPVIAFIMPMLYVIKARKHSGKETSKCEAGVMIALAFIMVILFFAGTAASIEAIMTKWATYGPPFHC